MRKLKTYLLLLLTLASVVGCSKDEPSPPRGDEVAVRVNAGSMATYTRAALAEATPLTLYVYQRAVAAEMNLAAEPYKVAEAQSQSGSNAINFTVGGQPLTVESGHTYDFVIIANEPSQATNDKGILRGIGNGYDVMSGRLEGKEIGEGTTSVEIKFTEYGADADGNLPHLVSGVAVETQATNNFIDKLNGENDDQDVTMSVSHAIFKRYPTSATMNFDSDPMVLNVSGARGEYELYLGGESKTVTAESDVVTSDVGYLLPYATRTNADDERNSVDIDFYIGVNGANLLLGATAVQLPPIKANYRYTFTTKMDADPTAGNDGKIDLYLTIEKWNGVDWESGMGTDSDTPAMLVKVGGWSSVSWSHGMGGDSDDDKLIFSVSGWSSVTWSSEMGGTEE